MNILFLTSTFPRHASDDQAPFVWEQAVSWKRKKPDDRVIILAPGDISAEVKETVERFKRESFPAGMDYEISYAVASFLDASIEQVLETLLEAFILVALVVFVFLGDWRSTLIPTLAVPVSLVGTFFFMQLFGVNINLITLFALVLAIGIVVDNAIVVVEAVHAKMEEKTKFVFLVDAVTIRGLRKELSELVQKPEEKKDEPPPEAEEDLLTRSRYYG